MSFRNSLPSNYKLFSGGLQVSGTRFLKNTPFEHIFEGFPHFSLTNLSNNYPILGFKNRLNDDRKIFKIYRI